jgi:glutamate-ammonia-ligase adenylyltransferase
MRLRPSGQSGPVATSFQAFESYQKEQAWVWEHLALTRASPVAGDGSLRADIATVRRDVLLGALKKDEVLKETQEMRDRLAQVELSGVWDVKAGPGGAQDIDLFAQAASVLDGSAGRDLKEWLERAVAINWCSRAEADELLVARQLFWRFVQASRLVSDKSFDPETVGQGGVTLVLRDTGSESIKELLGKLEKCRKRSKEVIDRVMLHG